MKRIGVVGGLTAESTAVFYRDLTRLYIERCGNADYPEVVIFGVRFGRFMKWSGAGRWDAFADGLVEALGGLERAGADFAVIAANMPHMVFDKVQARTRLPMLHIADAVAREAASRGFGRIGLLGTEATMGAAFYPDRLRALGIECIVPEAADRATIQAILDAELFRGVVTEASQQRLAAAIGRLKGRGAQAAILGCTELPLALSDENSPLPVLDSTAILVARTLDEAMA